MQCAPTEAMATASQLKPPAPLGSFALKESTQAKEAVSSSARTCSMSGVLGLESVIQSSNLRGFGFSSRVACGRADTIKTFYSTL
jgi:hypothetical protein